MASSRTTPGRKFNTEGLKTTIDRQYSNLEEVESIVDDENPVAMDVRNGIKDVRAILAALSEHCKRGVKTKNQVKVVQDMIQKLNITKLILGLQLTKYDEVNDVDDDTLGSDPTKMTYIELYERNKHIKPHEATYTDEAYLCVDGITLIPWGYAGDKLQPMIQREIDYWRIDHPVDSLPPAIRLAEDGIYGVYPN